MAEFNFNSRKRFKMKTVLELAATPLVGFGRAKIKIVAESANAFRVVPEGFEDDSKLFTGEFALPLALGHAMRRARLLIKPEPPEEDV